MNFNCFMPAKLISGENCLTKNAAELVGLGKRCLIVTDKIAAKASGALDELIAVLEKNNITYIHFDKVGENPLVSICYEAGQLAKENGCGFIVAIGGGSVLDAGKAASVFATSDMEPEEIYDYNRWSKPLKTVLIGTTAGTGSEVTAVSVMTKADGVKLSITNPALYGTIVFADARYTRSCPMGLSFSAAIDAVSHAIEAYFSARSGDYSDGCATNAIRLIVPVLSACAKSKQFSDQDRDDLYQGALWAGLALNACGTGFPHPLGYLLTETFGIPHGYACGIFMPAYIEHAVKYLPQKAKNFESVSGISLSAIASLAAELTAHLSYSFNQEQVEQACKRFEGSKNLVNSPGGLSRDEIVTLLSAVH